MANPNLEAELEENKEIRFQNPEDQAAYEKAGERSKEIWNGLINFFQEKYQRSPSMEDIFCFVAISLPRIYISVPPRYPLCQQVLLDLIENIKYSQRLNDGVNPLIASVKSSLLDMAGNPIKH